MTRAVTISRNEKTWRPPWGVYLGGVQVAWCATFRAAKKHARQRFGITRWDRGGPGYYREHIDERNAE